MAEYSHIKRNFGPVYDQDSRVLILGSFPSVKSREAAFFYGHPQNRFWPLLGRILGCEMPADIEGRKSVLLHNHIALWDTIEECDIVGSSDSSIKNVVPVDIMKILDTADIQGIYCNGATSYNLFIKYLYPVCGRMPVKLPSTSPANAAWNMDRLYEAWKDISSKIGDMQMEQSKEIKRGCGNQSNSSSWKIAYNEEYDVYVAELSFSSAYGCWSSLYEVPEATYIKAGTFEDDDYKTEE